MKLGCLSGLKTPCSQYLNIPEDSQNTVIQGNKAYVGRRNPDIENVDDELLACCGKEASAVYVLSTGRERIIEDVLTQQAYEVLFAEHSLRPHPSQ